MLPNTTNVTILAACNNVAYTTDHTWWFDIMGCDFNDISCLQNWNTIHVAALIPTSASIFASIYIIIAGTYYNTKFKNLGVTAQLPIFISISDLIFEMCHGSDHVHNILTGYVSEGLLCQFFGAMKPFSINTQTSWALGTAFYLCRTIMRPKDDEPSLGKYNWKMHIPCWGIPTIILIIGFIYDVYGIEGPWCGIKDHIMYVTLGYITIC